MTKKNSFCTRCNRDTNHFVHFTKEIISPSRLVWTLKAGNSIATQVDSSVEKVYGYTIKDVFELVECCGCDWVTLIHTTGEYDSKLEDWVFILIPSEYTQEDEFVESRNPQVKMYPPPNSYVPGKLSNSLIMVQNGWEIGERLHEIYEVKQISTRATLMLIRSFIEMVLHQRVGHPQERKSFHTQLHYCLDEGYLTKEQWELLDQVRKLGNDTVHNGFNPSPGKLDLVLHAMEILLWHLYGNKGLKRDLENESV